MRIYHEPESKCRHLRTVPSELSGAECYNHIFWKVYRGGIVFFEENCSFDDGCIELEMLTVSNE